MLEHALHPRTERELGLVAEIDAPDGIDIVAGARYVLAGNRSMLNLARRLGFTVNTDPNDAMVKIVRLDLTP